MPVGRYIAPANSASCIQIQAGDCAPRTLLLRAPFFTRFDLGVTKQFPIHGRTNFELRVDVLNLFDNINFDPAGATGGNPRRRHRDGDLPDHHGLHGSEQHLRSGRARRADRVQD